MRNLKFRLKRDSLNQIYISFMRPILEYASLVWDNCTEREKKLVRENPNRMRKNSDWFIPICITSKYLQRNWLVKA